MPGETWPQSEVTVMLPVGSRFQKVVVEQRSYTYSSRSSPDYPRSFSQNPAGISKRILTNHPWHANINDPWIYPQMISVLGSKEFRNLSFSSLAALDRKALKELSSRKLELGLLLAERAKTAELIYKTAVGAEGLIRKYGTPQGRISRALGRSKPFSKKSRRLSRKLAGMQLAFAYGWAPLAAELHALATGIGKGDLRAFLKVRNRETTTASGNNSSAKTVFDITVFHSYFLSVRVSDPMLLLASEFGLTNPATIAWELTPWSFAIDWVIPIGDFLAQFDATYGLDLVGSECSLTTGVRYHSVASFLPWTFRGGSAIEEYRAVQRTLGNTPKYRLPPIENPFSSFRRAINQISLLISLGISKK